MLVVLAMGACTSSRSKSSTAATAGATTTVAAPQDPAHSDLGPNVFVFNPSMPQSQIQDDVDSVADQQVSNQFGAQRFALLFEPGAYGSASAPLDFQVGYYTTVAGLGASPRDVTINGAIDVYNQCLGATNCIALNNFWRSLSNLTINIAGKTGCRAGTDFWAVSQASPMRRVAISGGNLSLMDYCSAGPQYASGGFISDSTFTGGHVLNGSQTQFIVRNSNIDRWTNGVWNQVFSGDNGAPAACFPAAPSCGGPYTTLATSPVTREEPFLTVGAAGRFSVFVPALQMNSVGPTWTGGATPGISVPIDRFFIARPSDSAARINAALASGRDLLLSPGVYHLDRSLVVAHPDTIVLGLGFPTLVPTNGDTAMQVADVRGVKLSGILFDAGTVNSPALLQVGSSHHPGANASDPGDPTLIQDVFFRVGGHGPARVTATLVVNSSDVLVDDIWAWRADHGTAVGWTSNTSDTGVLVNGDDVTMYGLFVEHFQKFDVLWNGERGRTIFFQNEMPYDPPNQAAWKHDGILGWAAYKVADSVTRHDAWGLGSYCFFHTDPSIHASHAFEAPVTAGVRFHDLVTVSLGGVGTIDHVINEVGAAAHGGNTPPVNLVSFP
jgi:hypothetical protein